MRCKDNTLFQIVYKLYEKEIYNARSSLSVFVFKKNTIFANILKYWFCPPMEPLNYHFKH